MRNTTDASAAVRARSPREKLRRLHSHNAPTPTKATPLITRCVNSMMVSIRGATGTTSPLHIGQWLPHPAPDPLARTKSPHKTTITFHASTPQAKRVKFAVRVDTRVASVAANLHVTANLVRIRSRRRNATSAHSSDLLRAPGNAGRERCGAAKEDRS